MSSEGSRSFEAIPFVNLPHDYSTRLGAFLAQMYEQHGPIFRSVFFGDDVVYLVGPEANRFVLSSERLKFSHREGWRVVLSLFGNGILTMDGEEHAQHRQMMNPAFTINYMEHYIGLMRRIIDARISTWEHEIDIYEEMRKITFDVAAEALAGLQTGEELDYFRELFVEIIELGGRVTDKDAYKHELKRLRSEMNSVLLPKIQQRRRQPTNDILGTMVQAHDAQGNRLTDDQIIGHTNILLVAGHETTTSLSAWLFYLLTQHPNYTARIKAELSMLLDGNKVVDLATIKQMKLLDYAIDEAERMYPPIGNGPRGAAEDFEFNGYHVPARKRVFYSIAATHLNPRIFANPETFDPERFAPPREEHKATPYALVGFGGGSRICLGINFAQIEIKLIVQAVLARYHLEFTDEQSPLQYYRGHTGYPQRGIKIRLKSFI
jgi:retinoid hydroxylase